MGHPSFFRTGGTPMLPALGKDGAPMLRPPAPGFRFPVSSATIPRPMRYERACIESIGYELPPTVVTSAALEARLEPLYQQLHLQPGQLEALTGIRERRFWKPGATMVEGATRAAQKALAASGVTSEDIGMLIYAGVCRDYLEPANACAVADALGLSGNTEVYDVSNACLGVINGIVQVADRINVTRQPNTT